MWYISKQRKGNSSHILRVFNRRSSLCHKDPFCEKATKPPAKERKVNAEKSVWESQKSSRPIFLLNQQEIIKSGHQESAKGHCHTLALTTGGVFIHSQQGGDLLYTNKDYRTVLTPGETQEPLQIFLNTYLPTYLLAHQYNPPSSPHT